MYLYEAYWKGIASLLTAYTIYRRAQGANNSENSKVWSSWDFMILTVNRICTLETIEFDRRELAKHYTAKNKHTMLG